MTVYVGNFMPQDFPSDDEVLAARDQGRIGALVEGVLAELIGLPLRELHRAADMIVLGFGEDVLPSPLPPHKGSNFELRATMEKRNAEPRARSRLHVQCPFRLDSPSGPFLGGHDIYRGAEPPHDLLDGDSWTPFGSNLFDRRAAEGAAIDGSELLVANVSADAGGGFSLSLSEGWSIVVTPASAAIQEFWRFFHVSGDEHFVVFPEND